MFDEQTPESVPLVPYRNQRTWPIFGCESEQAKRMLWCLSWFAALKSSHKLGALGSRPLPAFCDPQGATSIRAEVFGSG